MVLPKSEWRQYRCFNFLSAHFTINLRDPVMEAFPFNGGVYCQCIVY